LTDFPFGHSAAYRVDAADDFMSGNARQSQTGVNAGDGGRIGVTDSGICRSTTRRTPGAETSTALYVPAIYMSLSCVFRLTARKAVTTTLNLEMPLSNYSHLAHSSRFAGLSCRDFENLAFIASPILFTLRAKA
jgi:hypothetical protein